jgi:hypothetical protein
MLRALIAMVALGIAVISAIAFMRVLSGITAAIDRGRKGGDVAQPASWHLLHTPTRILLQQYRAACPDGKLGAYLHAIYVVLAIALVALFATVDSFFFR